MSLATRSIKSIEAVLDLAIWLEKHGQVFYESARDAVADEDLKALFDYLVAEEQKHCEIYKKLAEKMTGEPVMQESLFGEYGAFIELLLSEITENLMIKSNTTEELLLAKAILFEKDTLMYFNEMKNLFAGQDLVAIEAICAEEKKHITRLVSYKREKQR